MKPLKNLLFFIFIIMSSISCNENEEQTNLENFESKIIGSWETISFSVNEIEMISSTQTCFNRRIFTSATYEFINYFDYDNDEGCVVVIGSVTEQNPYSIVGNVLTVHETSSDDDIYEIMELNSTSLKLKNVYTVNGVTFTEITISTKL